MLSHRAAIDISSGMFELLGARSTSGRFGFDRYWRNARTISVHNPLIYKLQVVGDHVLNDADLPYAWSAGKR